MNIQEIVSTIFQVVIIPLLGILVYYFKVWISAKAEELKAKTDNEIYQKYIDMLNTTISNCVLATQQTYVETLKQQGSFDKFAQKKAFEQTYNKVLELLNDEAQKYLNSVLGDLEKYITEKIEKEVYLNKHW